MPALFYIKIQFSIQGFAHYLYYLLSIKLVKKGAVILHLQITYKK